MIKIERLTPRKFAWYWNKDSKVLLIGLYWFTVGVDLGITHSNFYKHFMRNCPVCGNPLNVDHRLQVVRFHRQCRTEGRAMMRRGQIDPVLSQNYGFWQAIWDSIRGKNKATSNVLREATLPKTNEI